MTKQQKSLLIKQALKLTTLGIKVEQERDILRRLVEQGYAYTSPEMREALTRFRQVDAEWKQLEAEHLASKVEIQRGR